MRIPWAPVTSSDGVKTPTNDVLYDKTYRTASNSVSHKAFQNLPMNTAAPAVRFEEPNPNGRYGSTKIRQHGEGAGENYVDSFVTHPIPGNYASIVATLENQTEQIRNAVYEPTTLAQVAEWGYRNLGANADEEKYNNLRDRLRFSGASDDEIESILKERKKQTLLASLDRPLTNEQRQILQAEDAAHAAIGRGAIRADRANPMGARPPADTNVFDFPNPGPPGYVAFNQMAEPGNQIFAGRPVRERSKISINFSGGPTVRHPLREYTEDSDTSTTVSSIMMPTSRRPRGPDIMPRVRPTRMESQMGYSATEIRGMTPEERIALRVSSLEAAGLGRVARKMKKKGSK